MRPLESHRVLFPAFVLLLAAGARAADGPIDADVVLKAGTLHDGRGGEPVVGDVAIRKDRIVALGTFGTGKVGHVIDCRGLIVAPGFIDLHNHSDRQVVDRLTRGNVNFLMQGCTTVITGNCGSGPVDAGKYHRQIDEAGAGTNAAHLLPQGSLREAVVGTDNRKATDEELTKMKELAAAAMRDGVWGMSTGLIYVPSSYADTAEITEIAKVVAAGGGIYASHIRGEGTDLLSSVDEAIRIGRDAGLPVHVSHFKASGQEAWGLVRQAIEMIDGARKKGQVVTADQYPYIASSTSLEATLIPTWARAGGSSQLLKRLDDPEVGPKLRGDIEARLKRADDGQRIRIARYAPHPEWAGKSIAQIADDAKNTPLDIALEITRGGGAGVVNFGMSEDDVRLVMQQSWVATASDGRAYLPGGDRPHPRSYGTFCRKIGRYSIEENVIPLAMAIRSASGLPADILGLKDRGYLKEGQYADVVVFDPKTFRDTATFDEPHRYGAGVRHVFVNGELAVHEGNPTGALAGRALKKSSP